MLHQLLSFEVSPGVEVVIHRTVPTLCIKFEKTELAPGKEIAKNIFALKTRLDFALVSSNSTE